MYRLPLIAFMLVVFYSAPIFAAGETSDCPSGERPAVLGDAAVQNGQIKIGTCYNPNDTSIGQTMEGAKKELAGMWCNGRAPSCRAYTTSVEQLDPKFAVCALKFLKAVRQQDSSICITSAYRSTLHQSCVCSQTTGPCASPGNSKHQFGLALDIIKPNQNELPAWVHTMARQGFGVIFPIAGDSGHFEPIGTDGQRISLASIKGGNATVGGDCSTVGYSINDETAYEKRAPSSRISDYVRDYLGGDSQSSAACNACRENPDNSNACMQCSGGSQPRTGAIPAYGSQPAGNAFGGGGGTSQTPSTAGTSGTTGTAQPVSSTLTGNTGTQNTPVTGSSGNSTSAGSNSTLTTTPNPVSSLLNTTSNNNSSAFDSINAIANPTTTLVVANTSATGSPIALNNTTAGDVVAINNTPGSPQGAGNDATLGQNISSLTPGGQQTFVSEDLSGGIKTARQGGVFQNNAILYNILGSLKQVLLKILDIIRPFRSFGSTTFEEGE